MAELRDTFVIDTAARRRAGSIKRRKAGDFRAVVHHNADAMVVLDREGCVQYANSAAEDLLNLPADELAGANLGFPVILDQPVELHILRELTGLVAAEMRMAEVMWAGEPSYLLSIRDMTRRPLAERERTEKALRESEEKYRELVENANSVILRWDMRGRLTFFNEFAEKLLGFSKDEVLGRDVVGTIVPFSESTGRDLKALMEEVKQCPERYQLNVNENVCKNGERVWIAWTNKAIRDEGGNVVEILSVGNNITERMRAEEALRKSELHLARAQQIARIGSWLLDLGEDRFHCSDVTYGIFGLRPGEIVPSYGDFLGFVHPGDRERVDMAVRDALVHGNYNAEFRIIRNDDGEERYVHSEADTAFDDGGNPVELEGTVQDITERRRAEESLKLTQFVLDKFRDSAIWLSKDKRIIYVNDEACRSLGYTRDELLSMHIWDVDPDVDDTRVRSTMSELKQQGGFNTFEQMHIARDGRVFPVEVTACFTRYGDKEYIITFDRDITERKRAEGELKAAKMEADLYVDLMCHDISNMNQVGLGFLEMALDMLDLGDAGREMLIKPKSAFENSSRLIDNVRKLQKARSGEYPSREMDIGEVLGQVRDDYSGRYGSNVTINYAVNAGRVVKANELLYDLFSNLVGNAIKHSKTHPTIDIAVEPVRESGRDYYKVGVDDRGPGIPDELKAVIFDRKLTGDTRSKGSGIGLYMAKALADSYGGRIWAEDRVPGDSAKGARFVVMLPALGK